MDDDATTEILRAIHRALCEHGYADLTLRNVAVETDESNATIHADDGNADRFPSVLEFRYERCTGRTESVWGGRPYERLRAVLDAPLEIGDECPDGEFRTAMLTVSVRSPSEKAIRTLLGPDGTLEVTP